MGTQAQSQHSFTFDQDTLLQDAVAVAGTAPGEVAATPVTLDFGNVDSNSVVQIAYTSGMMVADITALDTTTGDEQYSLLWQLSDNATFASGTVAVGGAMLFGAAANGGDNADDDFVLGRRSVGVSNEIAGTLFRFARLDIVGGGTTPIFTGNVYFTRLTGSVA